MRAVGGYGGCWLCEALHMTLESGPLCWEAMFANQAGASLLTPGNYGFLAIWRDNRHGRGGTG